jgi:hypothetical protein
MNAISLLLAQVNTGPDVIGGMFAMMLVLWVIGIAATIFWLWMLIDALVNEPGTNETILWFLVIFFLHVVGALIYFIVRRSGRLAGSRGAHAS